MRFEDRFQNESPLKSTVLGIGFLLLPIAGAFLSQFVTHAYVPRYFLAAAIGLAICICNGASAFSRLVPGLVVLLTVPLTFGFSKAVAQEILHPADTLPSIDALTAEQTPLLFDTPANYAQIYHYFPSLRNNMWVIADPSASLRYRGYDTDDKIMLALAEQGSAQTIGLSAAVHRWPHFRLIPRSERLHLGPKVCDGRRIANHGQTYVRPFEFHLRRFRTTRERHSNRCVRPGGAITEACRSECICKARTFIFVQWPRLDLHCCC